MGQKVNPHGLRIGIINGWDSCWFADKKDFSKFLLEDYQIRNFIKTKYYDKGISHVGIERQQGKITISISTSKPGVLIGQKGAGVEQIKKELAKFNKNITININEVKQADLDAVLVAQGIAAQLEKRASFRRTMKQAMNRVMKSGAKGVKIMVGGRLDGAEIARVEHYNDGSIPLQTLRADINYGLATAHTTFGTIGVKVWIYKGEIIGKRNLIKSNTVMHQNNNKSNAPKGNFKQRNNSSSNHSNNHQNSEGTRTTRKRVFNKDSLPQEKNVIKEEKTKDSISNKEEKDANT